MNTIKKLLSINGLSKTYYSLKDETKVLDDISFDIYEGDFIGLIGPSGCGKSSILNILSSLDKEYKGTIKTKENLKIGYMFQEDTLFPWLTIYDNAMLGLKISKTYTKENINSETSKATTSILEKQMKEVSIEPPKNILIIDSNVYSAKILTEILNQFNVTVTSAKTGEEAIISVIDKTFDLILLDDSLEDIKVPKMMSDFASIAGFNSPVVLMSKQTEEEIKQIITKNNLSGYISKPINNIEVENMYASIIKKD